MSSQDFPPKPPYELEYYAKDNGREPAREFIDGLEPDKRVRLFAAMETVLQEHGKDVCSSEFGKPLRDGLYEFRVRGDEILLRLYFHPFGKKVILLLGGFDKGRFGEDRREQRAIKAARRNLKDWKRSNR